jgi:hypothetical protein
MYQDLADIIAELGSHNPDMDWSSIPVRVEAVVQAIISGTSSSDIIRLNRLQCIRGSILAFVAVMGCETHEGFLLDIAKTELLKIEWA